MRISGGSSDVCSSDLLAVDKGVGPPLRPFHVPKDAVHHLRIEIGFWMMGGKVVVGPYLCITFPAFGVIEVLFDLVSPANVLSHGTFRVLPCISRRPPWFHPPVR